MRYFHMILVLYVLCTGAYSQEFTIDIASPEYPFQMDPGDILYSNGANIRFTHDNLGLIVELDEVDGFSYGKDRIYAPNGGEWIKLFYSVDRNSKGKPGGVVENEVNDAGASGDKFAVEMWNSQGTKKKPWRLSNATDHGLTESGAKKSDLDGITYSSPDGVYFTVDPATAGRLNIAYPGLNCTAADILYQDNPSTSPSGLVVWASYSTLGLDKNDDINALAVLDLGSKGVLDSGDKVYISLKTGSFSANTWGTATVIRAYPGSLKTIYKPGYLDLDKDDDLNALGGVRYVVQPPALTEASLCIHNGGEYYVNGPFHGFPNEGAGKYFPSFTHWTATPNASGAIYPWKLRGYSWSGCQGNNSGSTWVWYSILQASQDNPWDKGMSWPYPSLYQKGIVPVTGAPVPIYGGVVPSYLPLPSPNSFVYPSSTGGFNAYLNIFTANAGTWNIPSTQPFYAWLFGYMHSCSAAITIPSSSSIWEFVWSMKGPNTQYVTLSGDEEDCTGNPGNKGRNYSLICDADNSSFWYWANTGQGVQREWAMCLFVCDAVTVPVNAPGSSNSTNPYAAYGFDVGSGTVTPNMSSGGVMLGVTTDDGMMLGIYRVLLAAFASGQCFGPYGPHLYRIPHAWDSLTDIFVGHCMSLFMHTPFNGYPACMWGSTNGAHSMQIPFYDSGFIGAEVRFSTYAINSFGPPMSASYMVTYF